MAALKMHCSSVIVGTNIGTSVESRTNGTTLASGNFVGLKMMPSLRAASFITRVTPVNSAPLSQLAK